MNIRLAKMAGDNNKGDYYPKGFWIEGWCEDEPKKDEPLTVTDIRKCSNAWDTEEDLVLPWVSWAVMNYNGWLVMIDHELWIINLNEN